MCFFDPSKAITVGPRATNGTLEEVTHIARAARDGIVRGTFPGARSDALITSTLIHATTLAVRGACASFRCLFAQGIAVGPFLALVVSVQPMGYVTFYELDVAVRRTSSSGGARAMFAFALFGAAALRVSSVGPSPKLHLALFVAILPRKTQAVV